MNAQQRGVGLRFWVRTVKGISQVSVVVPFNGVFQMPRTPAFRVFSCRHSLSRSTAFLFVFVIMSCHWVVIVIVSYISLFSKPARKRTTQFHIVLNAQQDCAMHILVCTGATPFLLSVIILGYSRCLGYLASGEISQLSCSISRRHAPFWLCPLGILRVV